MQVTVGRGIVQELPKLLTNLAPDAAYIIADSTVLPLLPADTQALIDRYHVIHTEPGEDAKTLENLARLCQQFFALGGNKNSCIVDIGGGSVGNVAGMVAALVYRGIHLVHIPTTLLSQLDSSVDVKHSVNCYVKNSIGTYHPPTAVLIDPDLLSTLPDREFRSGLAEALKHGFSQDMALVDHIVKHRDTMRTACDETIIRTLRLKLAHYHSTADKWKERIPTKRLTHLGHSVGKVLEQLFPGFFTHGEAISHGMVAESQLAHYMDLITDEELATVERSLHSMGLLPRLPDHCSAGSIFSGLVREEKVPAFALLNGLGNGVIESAEVAPTVIYDVLAEWLVSAAKY